jgi:TonB family protein
MIQRISLIVLSAAGLIAAQVRPVSCCNCENSGRSVDVVCLSAKEMRDHLDHIEPLKPSGLDKDLKLSGIVVVEIRFEPTGKIACARARSGHPMAISAAMQAVPNWTFKPLVANGVAKAGCGRITIKYRLQDQGSSTELQ